MTDNKVYTYYSEEYNNKYNSEKYSKKIHEKLMQTDSFEITLKVRNFSDTIYREDVFHCHNYNLRFRNKNKQLVKLLGEKYVFDAWKINKDTWDYVRYIIVKKVNDQLYVTATNYPHFVKINKSIEDNINDIKYVDESCYLCLNEIMDVLEDETKVIINTCCNKVACKNCYNMIINKKKCSCCRAEIE